MEQFDSAAVMKLMGTPEGKKLLQLLHRDGGESLSKAANAVNSGNLAQVQSILEPLLNGTEAQKLAEKLGEKFG